jgi:hypothetical protein
MDYIIGEGSSKDKASLPLATCKGRHIPNVRREEFCPQRLRAIALIDKNTHKEALLRSYPTATYDCLGMAFACRRTCLGIDNIQATLSMIFDDDDFRELYDIQNVEIGDIIVYKKSDVPTHVGVVISCELDAASARKDIRILSKWGAHGEYIHDLCDVPILYGEPKSFWTERRSAI